MVVRGPVHVIPRDMFGRSTQHTNVLLSHLPLALRDAIARAAIGLSVGDLSRWGIVRPLRGPNRMIEESERIPILDVGTIAMIKRGKIRVRPALREILFDSVRFADGTEDSFEAIIFATGYTPGLDKLIKGFEASADARGRPNRFGEETGISGLYFVGFKNPPTGALREIALEAPRVARHIGNASFTSSTSKLQHVRHQHPTRPAIFGISIAKLFHQPALLDPNLEPKRRAAEREGQEPGNSP